MPWGWFMFKFCKKKLTKNEKVNKFIVRSSRFTLSNACTMIKKLPENIGKTQNASSAFHSRPQMDSLYG